VSRSEGLTAFDFGARPIHVAVFGRSDAGRRRAENQDDFLVADLSAGDGDGCLIRPEGVGGAGPSLRQFDLGPRGALILVADGMGGAVAGGLASRLAATFIHQNLAAAWSAERNRSPQRFAALLREAVENANSRIHQQSVDNPDFHGMGTTATAVGLLDGFLYLAQVGDSRAYMLRNGDAIQLTRDQSMVQALIESGTLTEEEAEASGHRSVILQALGAKPQVEVDLTFQEARRGDTLILCSDGLTRLVRREELAQMVAGTEDLVTLCDRLIGLANERGGPDNITVVIARLDGEGLQEAAAGDAIGRHVFQTRED
jgi:PPM family protein phosphatase